MKKMLCIIICILSFTLLPAAEVQNIQVPVFFQGGKTEIEIGFCKNYIDSVLDIPESFSPDEKLEFKINLDGTSTTSTFYIWWKIYSTRTYKVTISGEPLAGGNSMLQWENEDKIHGVAFTSNGSQVVVEDLIKVTKPTAGCFALDLLLTKNQLESVPVGGTYDFNGTITLTVEAIS